MKRLSFYRVFEIVVLFKNTVLITALSLIEVTALSLLFLHAREFDVNLHNLLGMGGCVWPITSLLVVPIIGFFELINKPLSPRGEAAIFLVPLFISFISGRISEMMI